MGDLVELIISSGYTCDSLCNKLLENKIPATFVNLKSFRLVYNSSDPLSFLHKIFLEHLNKIQDSKRSFFILDKFDLWPSLISEEQESSFNTLKKTQKSGNSYLDSIRLSEGVDSKVDKCVINWTYKFLYWIRYSVLYLLSEEYNHNLTCLCVYGDPFNSRVFYDDLFDSRYELSQLLSDDLLNYLSLKDFEKVSVDIEYLKNLSDSLDLLTDKDSSNYYLEGSVYDNLNNETKILNLEVPFEVDFEKLELSSVTLICGPESSGKSTLLKAICKAWTNLNKKNKLVNSGELSNTEESERTEFSGSCYVFNLEYQELASQFVGCAESYVNQVFNKAHFNKPALVVFDGIELLFEKVGIEEERAIAVTVSNTLLNRLYNLEPGVKFLTCTSGSFEITGLSKAFLEMVTSLVVLSKNGT